MCRARITERPTLFSHDPQHPRRQQKNAATACRLAFRTLLSSKSGWVPCYKVFDVCSVAMMQPRSCHNPRAATSALKSVHKTQTPCRCCDLVLFAPPINEKRKREVLDGDIAKVSVQVESGSTRLGADGMATLPHPFSASLGCVPVVSPTLPLRSPRSHLPTQRIRSRSQLSKPTQSLDHKALTLAPSTTFS